MYINQLSQEKQDYIERRLTEAFEEDYSGTELEGIVQIGMEGKLSDLDETLTYNELNALKNDDVHFVSELMPIIETREPRGLFITKYPTGWTACDNMTGEAWTEDFETVEHALDWLLDGDLS